LLAIALPLTKEDFLKDLHAESPKDYAKTRQRKYNWEEEALWEIDHLPMVNLMLQICDEVKKMGCKVILNFTIEDLASINDYDVVTIVSHWNNKVDAVEFYDGMFTTIDIVEKIPKDFMGIFDLTICHSTALQDAIKKYRPSSLVIANKNPAQLDFRLLFYKTIIKMIYHKDINYIDAVADLRIEFIKNQNKVNYDKSNSNFKKIHQFFTTIRRRSE
jgi:hypothetical protein